MEITTVHDLYVAELKELFSAEDQMVEALRELAEVAAAGELRDMFTRHHEETLVQQERLEELLLRHRIDGRHTDQAMEALVRECQKMMAMLKGDALRDAGVIASAQLLEHYEISAYGTAAALAGQLGYVDDQKVLHQSLEEEKDFDERLTEYAKRKANPAAAKQAA